MNQQETAVRAEAERLFRARFEAAGWTEEDFASFNGYCIEQAVIRIAAGGEAAAMQEIIGMHAGLGAMPRVDAAGHGQPPAAGPVPDGHPRGQSSRGSRHAGSGDRDEHRPGAADQRGLGAAGRRGSAGPRAPETVILPLAYGNPDGWSSVTPPFSHPDLPYGWQLHSAQHPAGGWYYALTAPDGWQLHSHPQWQSPRAAAEAGLAMAIRLAGPGIQAIAQARHYLATGQAAYPEGDLVTGGNGAGGRLRRGHPGRAAGAGRRADRGADREPGAAMSIAARRTLLLTEAAKALGAGQDPLMNPFLSEHEVTLNECYDLAEQLAIGARIVARGLADPRSQECQVVMLTMARST